MSALDEQVGGDHYRKLGEFQPWKILPHWLSPEELRGYAKGEAIVYLMRNKGADDIEKAKHVLELYMENRIDKPGDTSTQEKYKEVQKILDECDFTKPHKKTWGDFEPK